MLRGRNVASWKGKNPTPGKDLYLYLDARLATVRLRPLGATILVSVVDIASDNWRGIALVSKPG